MNGKIMSRIYALFLVAMSLLGQAPRFRYERTIVPGGPGANRIGPDVNLLSGTASADLRDLRLYDAGGKETPYLLIEPAMPEVRWKLGNILPVAASRDPKKMTSGFEVDFHSAALIDRLLLNGIPAPFLKRFRLEGSGDRSHWTLLIAEGTLFDLPDEHLRQTEAVFQAGEYRYLRVTWDDRESGVVTEPRIAHARLVQRGEPPAPLRATAEFRKLAGGPGRSRFQIRLPGPHLPIAAIELSVNETRLLRRARVTESKLAGGEVVQQTLGSATLRRVVRGNLVAADLRVPIGAPEGREIEILVEDESNPPLNLSTVTLEFAPLPWIYFENPAGATISARYGDARLVAPRYDLEAMRQYVAQAEAKEARWGDARDLQSSEPGADAAIPPTVGAAIDPKTFRFSRAIPSSPTGLTALLLDAAVLAHAQASLADLRIADRNNRQIPYLLERCDDVLALDLPPLTREADPPAKKPGAPAPPSRYRLTLPFENLPASKVILTTTERLFQRNVIVQIKRQSADQRSDPLMDTVADGQWRHSDPDTPAPPLTLELRPGLGTTTAIIVIDEGDNRALALSAARLELPLYRLRFFYPPDGKLTLLYGEKTLTAPRYDLALLAPRLVGVSSLELGIDKESAAPPPPDKTAVQTKLFWGALIGAVLVLMLLLARLLRSEKR